MASITQRKNKDGSISYDFRASCGYNADGKQRRMHKTWTPDPKWNKKRLEKELRIAFTKFEEEVEKGIILDGRIKFENYSNLWMEEHAKKSLKRKTWTGYLRLLPRINEGIGHLQLQKIHRGHLNKFYENLAENRMRRDTKSCSKIDFPELLKKKNLTQEKLAAAAGLSVRTVQAAYRGNNINSTSADKIAKALNMQKADLFIEIDANTDGRLSPNTIRSYHRLISSILATAVEEGRINGNPAKDAKLPKMEKQEAAYLDEIDAKRIMELLMDEPIKYRVPIMFDIMSGLRRSELLGLPRNAVDFRNETIKVKQTLHYAPGFGTYLDTPKSNKSTRPMKLSRTAFLLLIEYLKWQDEQKELCGSYWKNKDGLLFTQDDGGRIHPDTLTKWFRTFADKHGYYDIHVHSLRHTYASLMIADGTPLVAVSKRLGHAQVSTTANIYSHVLASADEKAAQVTEMFSYIVNTENKESESA